jgi:hypothetical protein
VVLVELLGEFEEFLCVVGHFAFDIVQHLLLDLVPVCFILAFPCSIYKYHLRFVVILLIELYFIEFG